MRRDVCNVCGNDSTHGGWSYTCPTCADCGGVMRGASWSGRCSRCHTATLLPPESFDSECLGVTA